MRSKVYVKPEVGQFRIVQRYAYIPVKVYTTYCRTESQVLWLEHYYSLERFGRVNGWYDYYKFGSKAALMSHVDWRIQTYGSFNVETIVK